ncbi:MAG: FeoA family protein [Fusobacteriota bacterium]
MNYLNELKPGQKAVITNIEKTTSARKKIKELGIHEGKEVIMRRNAPLGDPMHIYLHGNNISIRKSEARYIQIENIEDLSCNYNKNGKKRRRGIGKFFKRKNKIN